VYVVSDERRRVENEVAGRGSNVMQRSQKYRQTPHRYHSPISVVTPHLDTDPYRGDGFDSQGYSRGGGTGDGFDGDTSNGDGFDGQGGGTSQGDVDGSVSGVVGRGVQVGLRNFASGKARGALQNRINRRYREVLLNEAAQDVDRHTNFREQNESQTRLTRVDLQHPVDSIGELQASILRAEHLVDEAKGGTSQAGSSSQAVEVGSSQEERKQEEKAIRQAMDAERRKKLAAARQEERDKFGGRSKKWLAERANNSVVTSGDSYEERVASTQRRSLWPLKNDGGD
jgi:hypothetical protein